MKNKTVKSLLLLALIIGAFSTNVFSLTVKFLDIKFHEFEVSSVNSELQMKAMYRALYSDIRIFHIEKNEEKGTYLVLSRPIVSSEEIIELFVKAGLQAKVVAAPLIRDENSADIEAKALVRNKFIESLSK